MPKSFKILILKSPDGRYVQFEFRPEVVPEVVNKQPEELLGEPCTTTNQPPPSSHQTRARGSYWKDVPEKALIGIGAVGILGKAQK